MKKLNNKILIGVLIGLTATFALSRVFRASKRQSNLRTELLKVDTAAVNKVLLFAAVEKGKEIALNREGNKWIAKKEKSTAPTEQGSVNNAIATLANLKPLRLITKKKEKWNEYSVGDSSTTFNYTKAMWWLQIFTLGAWALTNLRMVNSIRAEYLLMSA